MSHLNKLVLCLFIIATTALIAVSCRKSYRCLCSYNNATKMDKPLGKQVRKDAEDECNGYESTVTGEKWTCTIY